MEGKPYDAYMKMGEKQRLQFVQNKKQQQKDVPLPLQDNKFPEVNFVQLYGTQDKKPIKLATYRYPASDKCKGVVVLFHSMGLHSGLSANLAARLSKDNYTAVAMDLRGHGNSEGQRCYINDYNENMKDVHNFLKAIKKEYSDVPIFLLGHGAGCLMLLYAVTHYNKQFNFTGIILAAPSLKRPGNSKVLSALSDVALKLMPNRTGLFNFVFQNLTKNKLGSKYLTQDKLVYHDKVFVGTLMQMMKYMDNVEESAWPKLNTPPIAIIQGECDKVSDPINTINFYEKIPTKDKEIWYFKNLWNCFYLEEEFHQISEKIVNWLNKRA